MLVDAGEIAGNRPRLAPARPDDSRPAGEWLTRYIRRAYQHGSSPRIDYALLTHFHGDHMGAVSDDLEMSESGSYRLNGITRVGEEIPIRKMLDHGWPDYSYPSPHDNANVKNYRAFLEWQMRNNGLVPERFQPGRNDQIVLVNFPEKYPSFEVAQHHGQRGDLDRGRVHYAASFSSAQRSEHRAAHRKHVKPRPSVELWQFRLLHRR